MEDFNVQPQTGIMPQGTRGRPKKAKKAPAPTSVRLMEPLAERLSAIVGSAPLTKNEVLQIVISLGLEQLEANPRLLLERHVQLLQEKMIAPSGEA